MLDVNGRRDTGDNSADISALCLEADLSRRDKHARRRAFEDRFESQIRRIEVLLSARERVHGVTQVR
jgi:hypothetical protein